MIECEHLKTVACGDESQDFCTVRLRDRMVTEDFCKECKKGEDV